MSQAEVRQLAARGDLSFLAPERLQEWVVAQRWFGSKGRQVSSLEVLQAVPLRDEEPLLVLALIAARFPVGTHDLYQLPIGIPTRTSAGTRASSRSPTTGRSTTASPTQTSRESSCGACATRRSRAPADRRSRSSGPMAAI